MEYESKCGVYTESLNVDWKNINMMEQQMNKIAVLLSSYNGYEYIEEQIDSICKQKNVDFTLYIRDDGSEKEFVELLCGLQKSMILNY